MTTKDVMTEVQVHDLLQRMFAAFTNPATKPEQYAELLTPDYIQRVDGKQLDYACFLHHSAKAISEPTFIAVMVTTGMRQLRSAWRK